MFKSARWRSDKSKIKAVFKLQFHATQDQKTGKINEKIYRFVVATGSSVFGVVGEVSVDFSKYSDATKLSSVSLPLKYARSTSVLHVSIQRVQNQREVNECDNVNEDNNGLTAHSSNGDIEGSPQSESIEEHAVLTDNNGRDHGASSVSDITLSGSDSSSGLDTPRQAEPKNTKPAHETDKTTCEEHKKSSQWDWLDGSVHELSTDDSSMLSPRETLSRQISEEGSPDDVIKKLKGELVVLARQAEVSEMEIQTLRKQIVKESKRGQDLSKEVAALKEERNELKEECGRMKVKVQSKLLTEGGDQWALVDELRQELNYEKDLNSNLRLQLQKTQESNAELILAVRDLDEMLESKEKCSTAPKLQEVNSRSDTDDEDQKALEDIVREHSGKQDTYLQEQKIIDLYNEIELYKRDKDELEMQMEQIALDYEILKQENHDLSYKLEQSQIQEQLKMQYECSTSYATVSELESQIENLHNELKLKSKELSESTLVIKELETQIKNLEEDLSKQAEGFEADMEDLIRAKVEQEQRAINAEENLRKVKLQNANTAGKLQEEFRKLSIEMASAFRENENAAMKAIDEANKLRFEKKHLEETIKNVEKEFDHRGNQYEDKLVDLSKQITLKSKQLEEMEKQIEKLSHELTHQKTSYNAMIEDLDGEINDRETEIRLVKVELESLEKEFSDLKNATTDKDNEVERLQSEIERLKSRCNDMKQFCKDNELEKENLKKQNQINLKEIALERAEASFMDKEIDLKHKIEDLERRVEVLGQNVENPQVSTSQNPNPATKSDDAETKKTGDQDIFELLNKNKCMEVELKEMQERYSEISLKFAEVEGERQQLVMTLRNLKNSKVVAHT
ncbi:hypothetical protein M8C21_030444 [Ambrosia artemisiifolia]|uniref:C2 NT-type domain-containing protein n=1 Tax=Ambrosia artemisiifolia TaxID=4212 RepID=A0AAD5BJY6_AMBAR|nr:hypothetical protein M8C21_030444 [Ambrosia artemisiifolia]